MTAPEDRPAYPLRLDARLDAPLSRWLWLVKWLLAIPHYVILVFLWIAFFVLTVLAFFAIVFTGRYPRAIFDFNVGVMRWTWRVDYYAYSALGTDRYPPFTLDDVADYPAHLDVEYPEHLSRGLVWVKWWLLAIPQYIIVGLLVGGGSAVAWQFDDNGAWAGGGLIGILVLIAGVSLLFRKKYPPALYDLVVGFDRWAARVGAYAALMTDRYPPFRLDQGGRDPGTPAVPGPHSGPPGPPPGAGPGAGPVPPGGPAEAATPSAYTTPLAQPGVQESAAPAPPPAPPPTAPGGQGEPGGPGGPPQGPGPAGSAAFVPPPPARTRTSRWTAGRVVAVTIGAFVMFVGLAVLSVGITALVADQVLRNDDGYLTSPTRTFTTSSYALVSTTLDINGTSGPDNLYPRDLLGDVRVRVTPHRSDQDVFVGIARRDDLRSLLKDTAYTSVTHIGENHVVYVQHRGGKPAQPWDNSTIWSTTSSGTGTQSVVWPEQDGDWVVLVANTNGSAGLDVDADIGATLPHLTGVAIGLIIGGLLSMALGLAMILAATSRASAPPAPPAPQVPEPRIPVPQ